MFKFVLLAAIFGLAAAASLSEDALAETKNLDNEISPEGAFHYGFQTSNGIEVASAGNADAIQGSYKYISPEGVAVVVSYLADADGYKPASDLLPTPPAIPEAIIRSLEYNAAHPVQESAQQAYRPVPVAPVYKPAPAYRPAPTYRPAPVYKPAPAYKPASLFSRAG